MDPGQAAERWQEEVERLRQVPAFDAHWQAYQRLVDEVGDLFPAWRPETRLHQASNIASLAADVGCHPSALHAWTIKERDAYWGRAIAALGIPFDTSPRAIRGSSDERRPCWLDGARFNIAAAWVDRAPAGHVAIVYRQEGGKTVRLTYSDLRDRVARFAAGLVARGIGPGDGVALYMPMTVEAVVAYLGTIWCGAHAVGIPDSFQVPEVVTRLRLGSARLLVSVDVARRGKDIPMAAKAREAARLAGTEVAIVGAAQPGDVPFSSIDAKPLPVRPMPADAVANVLFSSGTTGEPKAIPWTHTTPIKAAADGRFHQDIRHGDVTMWPTNMGWMMGPWLVFATLQNGATMALYEGAPGRGLVEFARDSKVSMLGTVPALVRAWREAGMPPGSLPDVRVFSSTGEASNAEDSLYLMSLAWYRAPVIEYCGGTEIGGGHLTGSVIEAQTPARFTTPALGSEIFVIDADGRDVRVGGMGELFLGPPSIGLSERLLNKDHDEVYYADCPTRAGRVLRRHGDEVQVVAGGYVAQGRADDTMNLGGIKVASVELERVMAGEGVRETAAVAVPRAGGGADRLVVFAVAPRGDAEALRRVLQGRIRDRLNPLFKIDRVVLVDALPRTASNKVMRRELRASLRENGQ